jgi:hypothetical protein
MRSSNKKQPTVPTRVKSLKAACPRCEWWWCICASLERSRAERGGAPLAGIPRERAAAGAAQ